MRKLHVKHLKVGIAALMLVALVGVGAVHVVRASSGTFYTDPATESVSKGDQFTVTLYEDSDTQSVDTVNVVVNYDATKLQLISPTNDTASTANDVQSTTTGSPFGYFGGTYADTVNGASSSVAWVGTDLGNSVTGKQVIGTLTFKALVNTGSASLDLTGSNTALAGTSLDPVLTGTAVSFVDNVAPTVSVTAPANNATITGTTTVTASASDDVGVAKVEFYVDGTLESTDTSSPYSYSLDTTTLTAGAHTIKATAYDAAGNSTSDSVSVNVADQTAPTVSVTAPANNATISGTTTITASASDNVGVSKVEFYVDGTKVNTDSSSPYSYALDTTTLTTGAHTIKATAYDAAGNSTSDSVNVNVADQTAPTVSVTAPTAGATEQGTVSVTATAADDTAVTKVDFYVDGNKVGTASSSPYTYSLDTTTLTNASHAITAEAYDAAGNHTTSSAVNITVNNPDTTDPTLTINSPANNATISGSTTVTTTAADNMGVNKVEFYIDNTLKKTVNNPGPYNYTFDASTLTVGAHAIKVMAYDLAGNSVTKSVSVSVADTTPPTVSIADLTDGTILNNNSTGAPYDSSSYSVSVNASDGSGIKQVELKLDGSSVDTLASSPYKFNVDLTGLSCGSHTLQATATDNSAGQNTASSTVNVKIATEGDINGDCAINSLDISALSAKYGQTSNLGRTDLNGDGQVNFMDISVLAYEYVESL